jgi:16S rRNA processing protein RimM
MNNRGQVEAEKDSGSRKKSEPEFLAVGKLRKPFGLKGEMKFESFIDRLDIFSPGNKVMTGKKFTSRKIVSLRESGKTSLIRFENIGTIEDAANLTNQTIFISADQLPPLEEGSYYHHQLLGMEVEDERGKILGIITEILTTGANDVYVVNDEENNKETLIPAIKPVIMRIDIESNKMVVREQEWLD